MSDENTTPKKASSKAGTKPVETIRKGAIAASIWYRQSPAGFPYHDFSLSRSWKSLSTGRDGYSDNFFAKNEPELVEVITLVSKRISELDASLEAERKAA
jgi:hypothetical protein